MNAVNFLHMGAVQTAKRGVGRSGDAQPKNAMRFALPLLLAGPVLALTASWAQAHCERHAFSSISVAQIKTIYMRCAEVSSRMVLDSATMVRCSVAADELRDRGFNGNFEQLIAWWQLNRTPIQSSVAVGDESH
jgi:hypothetical protein